MTPIIAYYGVLLSALVYLWIKGGQTGRWGAMCLVATSLLTLCIVLIVPKFRDYIPFIVWVDFLSLSWRLALAMFSTRRWPIWVAAFQVNVMAAHISVLLVPTWRGELYFAMITVWSIPTILTMVVGTFLDSRADARRA